MSGRGEESDSDAPEELTSLQVCLTPISLIKLLSFAIADVAEVELTCFLFREFKTMRRLEKLKENIRLGMLSSEFAFFF